MQLDEHTVDKCLHPEKPDVIEAPNGRYGSSFSLKCKLLPSVVCLLPMVASMVDRRKIHPTKVWWRVLSGTSTTLQMVAPP